jgi:integrase
VPIIPRLAELLVEHGLETRRSRGLVFGLDAGTPVSPNTMRDRARQAWKDADLAPITPHEARHTFVSLLIAAGATPKAIQTYAGHGSVAFTIDRYGHLFPGDEAATARLLEDYLDEHDG